MNAADLDSYRAHAWLLSPPCRPYTRQGLQKGSADARAFSFLYILNLLLETSHPPLMIFVENVVGFETSDAHKIMIEILAKVGFATQEFIFSPLQSGVPYSQPHYFCLAKRTPSSFMKPLFNHQLILDPRPLLEHGFTREFRDPRDADDARYRMNGREIDGICITVKFAKGVPRGSGGSRESREYLERGPSPGTGRCFNCGLDGHCARDCKAGDWKNKCYRCGEGGNIEKNCKNSPKKTTYAAQETSSVFTWCEIQCISM